MKPWKGTVFFTQNQDPKEGMDNYVTELKTMALMCNFRKVTDSLTRDRIICGTSGPNLRARLLRGADPSLDKCLQISWVAELPKERTKTIADAEQVHKGHVYTSAKLHSLSGAWVVSNPTARCYYTVALASRFMPANAMLP